ncbi:MAG: amylo-alpha-1,6-glucosidase, partial [Elusimicrobiota bacterium]
VRDAYNSPTVLFARLAGAARGVKHDAILVVEPFMDQRHGHNSSGLVDAYTLIDVTDRNQLNRQHMSDEIGRRGKIWLRVLPTEKNVSGAYVDMCKQAREAALSDYVSFPLEQEEGKYSDIIGFLRSIIGDAVMDTAPVNEKGYFDQGYAQCGALRVPVSALMGLQARAVEQFTLRSRNGTDTLMDLRVPGLAVLGVAYQFLKLAGDPGKQSLIHHSRNDDFFIKAFDMLTRAGVTEETAPEIWAYVNSLHSRALASPDDEMKVNRTIELFGFVQALQETVSYAAYVSRGGTERSVDKKVFKKLLAAADSFIAQKADGATEFLAGYPWFAESRSRDIFTSMSGILLAAGRYAEAREMFEFFAAHQRGDGLMPGRIFPDGKAEYTTADGSLWYIEALEQYYQRTGDKEFIKKMQPVVNRIIECYARPQGDIRLDTDGLVVTPAQWTWMDAAPQGNSVTPRNGKAVEIQALFYNALAIAADINRLARDHAQADQCEELKTRVGRAINTRFFEEGREYPADVVDGDPRGNAIRPNAVFLVSLSKVDDLLPQERKEAILKTVEEELLTPYGLRTLSPQDEQYTGVYDVLQPQEIKDRAYHQGTARPFLIVHYVRARAMARPRTKDMEREILSFINNLVHIMTANNTLPELFSGDEPQMPGGAVSQASSVAALLEVYDLLEDSSKHFALVTDRDFDDATNPAIYKHLFGAG